MSRLQDCVDDGIMRSRMQEIQSMEEVIVQLRRLQKSSEDTGFCAPAGKVEEYCRSRGISSDWGAQDRGRYRQRCRGVSEIMGGTCRKVRLVGHDVQELENYEGLGAGLILALRLVTVPARHELQSFWNETA